MPGSAPEEWNPTWEILSGPPPGATDPYQDGQPPEGAGPDQGLPPEDGEPDQGRFPPEGGGPGRGARPPEGGNGRAPVGPGEGGEKGDWRARWRQAILDRHPQEMLARASTAARALADRMQVLEGSLDAGCRFLDSVAGKMRAGETARPFPRHLVKEVVGAESFRHLVARILADLLRETGSGPAHSVGVPILCSAGHSQATWRGKEVQALKTQAPDPGFFWWIIIILLIVLLLFFFFPLGAGAGQ